MLFNCRTNKLCLCICMLNLNIYICFWLIRLYIIWWTWGSGTTGSLSLLFVLPDGKAMWNVRKKDTWEAWVRWSNQTCSTSQSHMDGVWSTLFQCPIHPQKIRWKPKIWWCVNVSPFLSWYVQVSCSFLGCTWFCFHTKRVGMIRFALGISTKWCAPISNHFDIPTLLHS